MHGSIAETQAILALIRITLDEPGRQEMSNVGVISQRRKASAHIRKFAFAASVFACTAFVLLRLV
jgi:hypothetical protein